MVGCEVKLALRAGKECLRFAARDPCRLQGVLEQTPSHRSGSNWQAERVKTAVLCECVCVLFRQRSKHFEL